MRSMKQKAPMLKSLLLSKTGMLLNAWLFSPAPAHRGHVQPCRDESYSCNPPVRGETAVEDLSLTPLQAKEIERRAAQVISWLFAEERVIELDALSDSALFAVYIAAKAHGRHAV